MKILLAFGTRPEALKLGCLANQLSTLSECAPILCHTGQHTAMVEPIFDVFQIRPHHHLNVMHPNQSLEALTTRILSGMSEVIAQSKPDWVVVQGDTTTTFASALAAFYAKVRVAHVEAGLRTGDRLAPWPEEANRILTTRLADLHFAPTEDARENLLKENIASDKIVVTGNTIIDALLQVVRRLESEPALKNELKSKFPFLKPEKKLILVTCHRRETFGNDFQQICEAILELASESEVQIVYPVHLNPNIEQPAWRWLGKHPSIHLIEPQDYLPFVYLMQQSYLILSDSGGIQEEACALKKPVLVLRNKTERMEAVKAGGVRLAGVEQSRIVEESRQLLKNTVLYQKMAASPNPFGDGQATQRIIQELLKHG